MDWAEAPDLDRAYMRDTARHLVGEFCASHPGSHPRSKKPDANDEYYRALARELAESPHVERTVAP